MNGRTLAHDQHSSLVSLYRIRSSLIESVVESSLNLLLIRA